MDVSNEKDFDQMANEYIYKIVSLRGDLFRIMDDIDLRNTIGMALGYPIVVPVNDEDKKLCDEGNYFMFSVEAEKHIMLIADKIKKSSDPPVKIKIIPLCLYHNQKMYQIPLFCFKILENKIYVRKYVDNVGRVYKNFDDWKNTNVLAAGRVAFPKGLKMDEKMMITFMNTIETTFKRRAWKIIDGISHLLGISTTLAGSMIPGSQTLLIFVIIYGMTRSANELYDRATHGQSISILNKDVASLWLNIAASGMSLASIGILYHVSKCASQGQEFGKISLAMINFFGYANFAFASLTVLYDSIYMICNWKDISWEQRLLIFAQMAFMTLNAFRFKNAEDLIAKFRSDAINDFMKNMSPEDITKVTELRTSKGDIQVLKNINRKVKSCNMSPRVALKTMISGDPSLISKVVLKVLKLSKTVDISELAIGTLREFSKDILIKCIKDGNLADIQRIAQDFPDIVLEYTTLVSNKIVENYAGQKYADIFSSILGMLSSSFKVAIPAKEMILEKDGESENDLSFENNEAAYKRLNITEKTNVNEEMWKKIIEQFGEQSLAELYESIQSFRALNKLFGIKKIKENETKDKILNIIEHGNIRFGSEPMAIYHFISEGLAGDSTDLKKYINDANDFIKESNFKHCEEKDGFRYFYYEQIEPYKYAVVSEHMGCLSLCCYKIQRPDYIH